MFLESMKQKKWRVQGGSPANRGSRAFGPILSWTKVVQNDHIYKITYISAYVHSFQHLQQRALVRIISSNKSFTNFERKSNSNKSRTSERQLNIQSGVSSERFGNGKTEPKPKPKKTNKHEILLHLVKCIKYAIHQQNELLKYSRIFQNLKLKCIHAKTKPWTSH